MDDAELDGWIDAATAMLGIGMKPDWLPAVRMHLRISLAHASTVLATELDDHLDPAAAFRA